MAVKNSVLPIPMTSADSSLFAGAYVLLSGAGGLTEPCIMLRIINDSNVDVTISYDGIADHDFVPTGTSLNLQFMTNSQPTNRSCSMAEGTRVYVKGVAGLGSVYIAGFFQPQGV